MTTSSFRTAILVALALAGPELRAQASPYVPLDDIAYRYVDALSARGLLAELSALERPYTVAALRAAADHANATGEGTVVASWLQALREAIGSYDFAAANGGEGSPERLSAGLAAAVRATAQTSGRRELMLADDSSAAEPGVELRVGMATRSVVAAARVLGDRRLRTDPEFAGKKDRSVAGRMEDGYLSGQWRYGELFLGRLGRSWGPTPLDGLALGSYAYSYDHVFGRLGDHRVNLTVIAAKLDEVRLGADSIAQRYFTIHRLAGRWRGLELAASEAVVYGGVDRGVELSLLNPLNAYDLSQYNERESINVGYTLEAAWRLGRAGTFGAQILLDDFQVDECETNCKEPPSYGLTLTAEGLPLIGAQRWFASYTRLSNLAYRTPQRWEQYSSFGVGLGRGFTDHDEVRIGADLALVPRTTTRVYAAYRRQGEGDYRLPFPPGAEYEDTPEMFAGRRAAITRIAVSGAATLAAFDVTADLGVNRVATGNALAGPAGTDLEGRLVVRFAPVWMRAALEP